MNWSSTPEADAQRAIVHHCANEVAEAGPRGAKRQSILVGMGVHSGFADLIVISGGRVLFLEVKSEAGRLRKSQEVFRDTVCAQGFWLGVGTVWIGSWNAMRSAMRRQRQPPQNRRN